MIWTPEAQGLYDDVLVRPSDPTPKLLFADYWQDHGRHDLAYAYRWAAARKLHPNVTPVKKYASWERVRTKAGKLLLGPHYLPAVVFYQMATTKQYVRRGWVKRFANAHAAFVRLAAALNELRTAVALDPKADPSKGD